MIERIRLQNIFSFIDADIELRPLNLLIGGNGVGKSNLVTAIGMLRHLPSRLSTFYEEAGGPYTLFTALGEQRSQSCSVATQVALNGSAKTRCVHKITFAETADYRILIARESLAEGGLLDDADADLRILWRAQAGHMIVGNESFAHANEREYDDAESGLSQDILDNPGHRSIQRELNRELESISIFDILDTSMHGELRKNQLGTVRPSPIDPTGKNLGRILLDLDAAKLEEVVSWVRRFNPRVRNIEPRVNSDGTISILFHEDRSSLPIHSKRASDGTLRFLRLAVLTVLGTKEHPSAVICLEEPEIGMHPDAIPILADLLREASKRSQIIVTTHSDALIDCFSDEPEVVMVTDRNPETGETVFQRLDKPSLQGWLDNYKLGEVWRRGRIGGLKD